MKNYLIYPCRTMRITQSYTGTTSHKPHTTGSPKDYPIDEGCSDTGRDYIYCPCDEMKVKRIYGVGTGGTNTIWLESTTKVEFADGTKDYCTMLITRPDDADFKNIKVGQFFARKEKICREGKDGATAYHLHISAGKGKYKGNGWVKNSNGKYVLTTKSGAEKPEKLFYIDTDFTKVVQDKGLNFKTLPVYTTGTYKVSTAVLNVRKGAGTSYKMVGTLLKGKKITVEKVSGDWGRYSSGKWVHLDYCKKV
jgi:hypothetical protein